MHAYNKTLGIIIAGAATLALTAFIVTPDQEPKYQVFDIKDTYYLSSSVAAATNDAIDDDQYEVHVRATAEPFKAKSSSSFITHGFENALRKKQFYIPQ